MNSIVLQRHLQQILIPPFLLVQPPEVWNGGVGFVSQEMVKTHCPAPAEDIQVKLKCTFLGTLFTSRCQVVVFQETLAARLSEITFFSLRFQILRCGPPPMNKAMAAHLEELGYTKEMQFQF